MWGSACSQSSHLPPVPIAPPAEAPVVCAGPTARPRPRPRVAVARSVSAPAAVPGKFLPRSSLRKGLQTASPSSRPPSHLPRCRRGMDPAARIATGHQPSKRCLRRAHIRPASLSLRGFRHQRLAPPPPPACSRATPAVAAGSVTTLAANPRAARCTAVTRCLRPGGRGVRRACAVASAAGSRVWRHRRAWL